MASPVGSQDALPTLTDRLAQTALSRMDRDGVPGAVVVLLREGAPVWTGAFGLADPAIGQPMTEATLMRVESLSKPVTAWAVMRLSESGRLDLDAPVTDCLQHWQPPEGSPPFTARQLLSHTAGIGLGDFTERYDPNESRPALPDHLDRDFDMVAAPGAGFAYSDTGYNTLELVIEGCAGEGFDAYVAREIFAPLEMDTARYDWPETGIAVGHDLRGRPVAPYVYPARGSGGLIASAGDMAQFTAANLVQAVRGALSPEGLRALHQPVAPVDGLFGIAADGYGLGYFTGTLSDGRHAVWHGGQGHGWMSHMHLVPETGDGIVILSNSQRAWPLFAALLRDWSESLGVMPVGMTRVLWAGTLARGAILGLLALGAVSIWLASRRGVRSRHVRLVAGGLAIVLLAWPIWAVAQAYLFLFSILPALWPWLAGASLVAGGSFLALALGPERAS